LYLKMKMEGLKPFDKVKHLVVDEMQDYSAVQYRVLNSLFPCKKTILGDINQSVNPFSASNLETIQTVFGSATSMTMKKSYRSTWEITEFTKKISRNADVEPLERHGEKPSVATFKTADEEITALKSAVHSFEKNDFNSMGIICKTQTQANEIHEALKTDFDINLLNAVSVAFGSGIVITTAHLAKGLEFDCVAVPYCTAANYKTEPDRQMLYVACTRAMHRLSVSGVKKLSPFLAEVVE
ncbi:MAG: ATP-binding domain-containing protein, partial [Flavobacteriales bacterium]|nr:ATP-binding domain-containing protein [Flavobacteriales bacterium]